MKNQLDIWLNLDWEISAVGVVNMKLKESGNLKRRKAVGATKRKAPEEQLSVPKVATVEHYLQLISDTMDIMDEFPEMIEPIIMQQGYTSVYLPP